MTHTFQKMPDGSGYAIGLWISDAKGGGMAFLPMFDVLSISEAMNAANFLNGSSVRMAFGVTNERVSAVAMPVLEFPMLKVPTVNE
jgi:hypothetical protein